MIKDLSKDLIKAVAGINQKSREAFVAEQRALQEKMAAKAMKMPGQPAPKADPAASKEAADMAKKNMKAEAAEGSIPRNEKEKKLAKLHGDPNKITHGDVLKGRGVRREAWEDMLKAVQARRENEKKDAGTGKFDAKKTSTGMVYTRKASTFDDGGKDADMKKADKKMKKEEIIKEGMHVMPMNNDKADSRYNAVMAHAKKMGYNVHHQESYGDEKSGNKGSPDITVHYQRGDDRNSASPEAIEIHKNGKAAKDNTLKAHASGKAVSEEVQRDTPGNNAHQCAIHVKSEQYGEGKTLFSQHAEPDADGNIAWYDVMFAEGIKRVNTEDIEILVSEGHMNHKKKKM